MAEEPFYTVRLNFEPKGNGHEGEPFYLVDKVNQCVCCGTQDELTGHHVVPICFRRHFPYGMKSRDSHDILILCPDHHHQYEALAWRLKEQLFREVTNKTDEQIKEEMERERHASSAAAALVHWHQKIPADRQEVLRGYVRDFLGHDFTRDELETLAKRAKRRKHHAEPLGKRVVDGIMATTPWERFWNRVPVLRWFFGKDAEGELRKFIRMWRIHFVEEMEPKFLPPHWSVNHRL